LLVTSAAGYAAWSRFGASVATTIGQPPPASTDAAPPPGAVVTTLPPGTRLAMNDGQAGRPDAVPPALAGNRFFEDLAPHEVERNRWYPLLNREPEELLWPGTDLSSHHVDPGSRRLNVSTESTALLALGETDSKNYTLQIDIHQNLWRGGVGVFLGYRKVEGSESPRWRFQRIVLGRRAGAGAKQYPFQLVRSHETLFIDGAGRIDIASVSTNGEFLGPLANTSQQLEVVVRRGRLSRVRWGGRDLPQLLEDQTAQDPEGLDYLGKFGVYHMLSDSTVLNARIRIDSGQQVN
ncbi:MAG: hypothetical protein WD069_15390, partial [Planctomycetales bacterium]